MSFQRASLLLVASLGSISCGLVYDFDGHQLRSDVAGQGGGQIGQGGQGSGSGGQGGQGGGQGGGGGGGPCLGANMEADPMNCGACGIDCAGGLCTSGVCSPVEVLLDYQVTQIASLNEVVFLVLSQLDSGKLVTVPVEFGAKPKPQLNLDVCDAVGFLTAGDVRVYYRPQNGKSLCGPDEYLWSCDTAQSCVKTTHPIMDHMNGLVVVGPTLFFTSGGKVHSTALSLDGIPSETENTPAPVEVMNQIGQGAYLLSHEPARNALWWTTFSTGGCPYTVPVKQPPGATVDCFMQSVPTPALLLVAPTGDIYAESDVGGIYKLDPGAMVPGPAPLFGSSMTQRLLAVDGDYVYAYEPVPMPSLVLLKHGTGEERARLLTVGKVEIADARHPKYAFFAVGSTLHRWRKPPVK